MCCTLIHMRACQWYFSLTKYCTMSPFGSLGIFQEMVTCVSSLDTNWRLTGALGSGLKKEGQTNNYSKGKISWKVSTFQISGHLVHLGFWDMWPPVVRKANTDVWLSYWCSNSIWLMNTTGACKSPFWSVPLGYMDALYWLLLSVIRSMFDWPDLVFQFSNIGHATNKTTVHWKELGVRIQVNQDNQINFP